MSDHSLDTIYIRDLLLRCVLGVNPEERGQRQDVVVNITLRANLGEACASDRIEDTIDYKTLKKRVMAMVEGSAYFLVERLAQRIAEVCLDDPRVMSVDVVVDKPGALRFARSVAVGVSRGRGGHA
ncbi:MAG: dihydroneopterin aldolase [Candidatus Hydrogenedentes bacterium]|nr:dihydroneopterin aldolase [Candidatus Hydrogenedentota bacterium]